MSAKPAVLLEDISNPSRSMHAAQHTCANATNVLHQNNARKAGPHQTPRTTVAVSPENAYHHNNVYTAVNRMKQVIVITSLFTKLLWPGDSKGTYLSSEQAATCHLSTTHGGGFTVSLLIAENQAGNL